jgi:sigma-B regulation protein RsbU (phosphoserine phosphatase)
MPDKGNIFPAERPFRLPCGLARFTDDGKIAQANEKLTKLLGYNEEELDGRNIEFIFSLATRIFYQTHFFPLLKLQGHIDEIFMSLKARSGEEIPVMVYGTREEVNQVSVHTVVFLPVWKRQQFEGELIKAKKTAEKLLADNSELTAIRQDLERKTRQLDLRLKELTEKNHDYVAFSKVISHDFQEPIRKAILLTDIFEHSVSLPNNDQAIYLQKIRGYMRRLRVMTQCLDDYVSLDIQAERQELLSLADVLMECRQMVIRNLGFDDFGLSIGHLPQIRGQRAQIKQLFYELLKNDIQYRDNNRRLQISVSGVVAQYNRFGDHSGLFEYRDFLKIEMSDNGRGFEDQYRQLIFQMFQRLQVENEGVGFGLTLCRKIAEKHAGSITARSTPGAGAVFTILLPVNGSEEFQQEL